MTLSATIRRFAPLAAALALTLGLSGCVGGNVLGQMVSERTEGYALPPDALAQIRPGQSQDLVRLVLGSPQTTSDLGEESAWYYVETKVSETAFGLRTIDSRKVLAVYFDKNKRVKDKALYGLKDGKPVAFETRRTPSYGEDKTFISSILSSF